jgi:hypothetical protein
MCTCSRATIGVQSGVLRPGEPAALLLGALVTIAVAVLSARLATRSAVATNAPRPGAPQPGPAGTDGV